MEKAAAVMMIVAVIAAGVFSYHLAIGSKYCCISGLITAITGLLATFDVAPLRCDV